MLNMAIVGLGGLGKEHLKNYFSVKERKDVKLVAICDIDKEQFEKQIETNISGATEPVDLSEYNLYTDIDEMIKNEKIDFALSVVPTYVHEEVAIKLMENGIHVISEKPMARNLEQCCNMIDAAKKYNVKLQIGQCCRFNDLRKSIKKIVEEGKYGKVIRAEFSRFSAAPLWSWNNWYMDFEKSGGAVLDLHVHDVDFIQWVFGVPNYVMSAASHVKNKFESICSNFVYDGFYVTSMTDWSMSSPFERRGTVNLETATIVLKEGDLFVTVYEDGGNKYEIPVSEGNNMYADEVIEFIDCIETGRDSDIISPESTMLSIRLALAEQESATEGKPVYIK